MDSPSYYAPNSAATQAISDIFASEAQEFDSIQLRTDDSQPATTATSNPKISHFDVAVVHDSSKVQTALFAELRRYDGQNPKIKAKRTMQILEELATRHSNVLACIPHRLSGALGQFKNCELPERERSIECYLLSLVRSIGIFWSRGKDEFVGPLSNEDYDRIKEVGFRFASETKELINKNRGNIGCLGTFHLQSRLEKLRTDSDRHQPGYYQKLWEALCMEIRLRARIVLLLTRGKYLSLVKGSEKASERSLFDASDYMFPELIAFTVEGLSRTFDQDLEELQKHDSNLSPNESVAISELWREGAVLFWKKLHTAFAVQGPIYDKERSLCEYAAISNRRESQEWKLAIRRRNTTLKAMLERALAEKLKLETSSSVPDLSNQYYSTYAPSPTVGNRTLGGSRIVGTSEAGYYRGTPLHHHAETSASPYYYPQHSNTLQSRVFSGGSHFLSPGSVAVGYVDRDAGRSHWHGNQPLQSRRLSRQFLPPTSARHSSPPSEHQGDYQSQAEGADYYYQEQTFPPQPPTGRRSSTSSNQQWQHQSQLNTPTQYAPYPVSNRLNPAYSYYQPPGSYIDASNTPSGYSNLGSSRSTSSWYHQPSSRRRDSSSSRRYK